MIVKTEKKIPLESINDTVNVFGRHDENLKYIQKNFEVLIVVRDDSLVINGIEKMVDSAFDALSQLVDLSAMGHNIEPRDLDYIVNLAQSGRGEKITDFASEVIIVTYRGKVIKPKTHGQKKYMEAIKHNDIVFGIGPAGTGKTYMAVAMAAKALKDKTVNRLIITRPAVEAGEKLGFLPGDLQEKVDPYLRPLYDALYDILGNEKTQKYLEKNIIEIAPLAYMRGRTLDDAVIILDEAQNTTPEQMKMFLTRLGFGSKAIITGDVTQVDLIKGQRSGLIEAQRILDSVEGLSFQYMTGQDVMRHPVVRRIVAAYEKSENRN